MPQENSSYQLTKSYLLYTSTWFGQNKHLVSSWGNYMLKMSTLPHLAIENYVSPESMGVYFLLSLRENIKQLWHQNSSYNSCSGCPFAKLPLPLGCNPANLSCNLLFFFFFLFVGNTLQHAHRVTCFQDDSNPSCTVLLV